MDLFDTNTWAEIIMETIFLDILTLILPKSSNVIKVQHEPISLTDDSLQVNEENFFKWERGRRETLFPALSIVT
jgi:hypothetical protein